MVMSSSSRQRQVFALAAATVVMLLGRSNGNDGYTTLRTDGDLILAAVFPLHSKLGDGCKDEIKERWVSAIAATVWALDMLQAEEPIPGVTIGLHIIDSCGYDVYMLTQAQEFITRPLLENNIDDQSCINTTAFDDVFGVVGPSYSENAIQLTNFLRVFSIPVVSYSATSNELSNRQRYPSFFRTIPPDTVLAEVVVAFLEEMNIMYFAVVYLDTDFGEEFLSSLGDAMVGKESMCIATTLEIPYDSGTAVDEDYETIVDKLISMDNLNAVLLWVYTTDIQQIYHFVNEMNAEGRFLWVSHSDLDSVDETSLLEADDAFALEGTVYFNPSTQTPEDFQQFYYGVDAYNYSMFDPWYKELWEELFDCSFNETSSAICTGHENDEDSRNFTIGVYTPYVIDAVTVLYYALKNMHADLCDGQDEFCEYMEDLDGGILGNYIQNISFIDTSGNEFYFLEDSCDPVPSYDVYKFDVDDSGHLSQVLIGSYTNNELNISTGVTFTRNQSSFPESHCSEECSTGERLEIQELECCWTCIPCDEYDILPNETTCQPCPQGEKPNEDRSVCEPIPVEYLRAGSSLALVLVALASVGALCTLTVMGVWFTNITTPVVMASAKELSFILLVSILMIFSETYLLVLQPTTITCAIIQFGMGLFYTCSYGAIYTKTHRISRIFNSTAAGAKTMSCISPLSQVMIWFSIVGGYVVFALVWMILQPPGTDHYYPTRAENQLICRGAVEQSYIIGLAYPGGLIVLCTVFAMQTRKIPEGFNEAKFIAFTMYTSCIVWLAFIPVYYTTELVEMRTAALSISGNCTALAFLSNIFLPKMYIIVLRPDKNTREFLMGKPAKTQNSSLQVQNKSEPVGPEQIKMTEPNEGTTNPAVSDDPQDTSPHTHNNEAFDPSA